MKADTEENIELNHTRLSELLERAQYFVTSLYFVLFMGVFPLYLENFYWDIGDTKWKFYLHITVPYVAVMLSVRMIQWVCCLCTAGRVKRPGQQKYSLHCRSCDWCVGLYGICVLLSFWLGGGRHAAWTGAEGWYMGVRAQVLFVLTYFVISRSRISIPVFLGCNAIGSGICFLIGILQRLGFDFLNLYSEMEKIKISDFLSTIGNRTWMSGYACVVFPIGVYLFWRGGWKCEQQSEDSDARRKVVRLLWGLYSAIAFTGLSATYSDSAYIGLAVVFFLLGVFSIGDGRRLLAFCQVLLVWFGSALLMCGLRALCGDNVRDARGVTCYVYEWKWMLAGLVLCAVVTALVYMCCFIKKTNDNMKMPDVNISTKDSLDVIPAYDASQYIKSKKRCRLQIGCLLGGGVLCVLAVGFIVLNSTGVLEELIHVTVRNRYLYFDDAWGDNRGWTWKMVCRMFMDLPPQQKLFGVGADCFAEYAYYSLRYGGLFVRFWDGQILTNSHNEWLNMFFCQGIVGGLFYLGIFVSAVCAGLRDMFRGAEESMETDGSAVFGMRVGKSLPPGIGLCVAAYMAHNFFCYQQICATGPVFVMLGVLIGILRGNAVEELVDEKEELTGGEEDLINRKKK